MLSCFLCIKTYPPGTNGNVWIRSGDKSQLRGPIILKNFWRVTTNMARLTKLVLSAHLPLDINFTLGNKFLKLWIPTRTYRVPLTTNLGYSSELVYGKQRSKFVNGGVIGTMGNPKGRKPYGSGGSVRELGFRCFSSNSNITANASVSLKELRKVNKTDIKHVNDKLIHIVSDLEVLILSYELIKSKPGNTTTGIDSTTLDKLDMNWFENTRKSLLAGKFKFKPARRTYIPKGSNKGKRPLTISSPRDKMIQQAMYLILDAIFEPSFLNFSHGSRPNRGNHTALKAIKYQFNGVKWCIEADIKSNFPSISHEILLKLLKRRISCSKFLALIKNSLKAGFFEDGKFKEANVGLFQGNITSPILNNVYLHELDLFMAELCASFNKGKTRRKSPIYRRISYLMGKETDPQSIKKLRRELWKVDSKDPLDPNFKRLYYIRYVDDFVVGVVGSRKEAADSQEKIRSFLLDNLKLTLSEEKTLLTRFSKDFIFFLGVFIKGTWEKVKRVKLIKKQGVTRKVRITSRVVLHAPIKRIFEKATDNGFFFERFGKFVPTGVGRLINLDHADIISFYNSVIRGILNYYSFANNRKSLGSFVHGLKFSCARTLALKFKVRHASKVYRKFGGKLKCPDTGIELFIPSTFKPIKTFGCKEKVPDEVLFKKWNNKLTKSNLFKSCIICGSGDHVEMHHVREIRDLKRKAAGGKLDWFTQQMAAINRKQAPLCSFHHKALHNNKLTLEERQLFYQRLKLLLK
jgi:group II intron reverse transcriptase/maturase